LADLHHGVEPALVERARVARTSRRGADIERRPDRLDAHGRTREREAGLSVRLRSADDPAELGGRFRGQLRPHRVGGDGGTAYRAPELRDARPRRLRDHGRSHLGGDRRVQDRRLAGEDPGMRGGQLTGGHGRVREREWASQRTSQVYIRSRGAPAVNEGDAHLLPCEVVHVSRFRARDRHHGPALLCRDPSGLAFPSSQQHDALGVAECLGVEAGQQ
jgi:hypothetical protein